MIDEILSQSLGEWEFERNAHLFRWPGALVVGTGEASTPPVPDTIEETTLLEQGYQGVQRDAPYPDRQYSPKRVPDKTTLEWHRERDRSSAPRKPALHAGAVFGEVSDPTPDNARPNAAADFDRRQATMWDSPVENPYGKLPPIDVRDRDLAAYFAGAAWVLGELSQEIMGLSQPLLQAHRVGQFGIAASCRISRAHWEAHKPWERIEAHLNQFRDVELRRVDIAVKMRTQRILNNARRWEDAGMTPVKNLDGSVNEPMTLSNRVTAYVACRKLAQIAVRGQSFVEGAAAALREFG